MKKIKKVLSAVLVAAFLLCCSNQGTVFAAVNGTVTGTLNEKSVTGRLTCNEVAHQLTIVLNYNTMSTLNGGITPHTSRNDAFGNNTQVSQTSYAGTHESTNYLKVTGYVDNSLKRSFEVTSYGSSTREHW